MIFISLWESFIIAILYHNYPYSVAISIFTIVIIIIECARHLDLKFVFHMSSFPTSILR